MMLSRRRVLVASASTLGVVSSPLNAKAACNAALAPSVSIDGPPEFLPHAPLRQFFTEGEGQRIRIFGTALSAACEPLAGARLDFWHTDAGGAYDMKGYKFRGAQLTDREGRFQLDTVMPGQYFNARHIHFLLATRIGNRPQPLMVAGAIWFPTPDEFAKAKPSERTAEFLAPDSVPTIGGVLMAQCDLVLETV